MRFSRYALALPLFFPQLAFASYFNDCLLHGVATTNSTITATREDNVYNLSIQFSFKVSDAEEYGRADSGCAQHIGKTISVEITDPEIIVQKGDNLSIINNVGNGGDGLTWDTYSLLVE